MRSATRWIPFALVVGAFLFAIWLLTSEDTDPGPHRVQESADRSDASGLDVGDDPAGPVRVADPTAPGVGDPHEFLPDRASVNGMVQFENSTRVVRGGSVEMVYLDASEFLEPPDLVQAWHEEHKSDRESYEETSIGRDGGFEMLLPVGSILRRVTLKPASLEDDLLAGFFDTERDLGDRILTEAGVTLSLRAFEGYTVSGRVYDEQTLAPIRNARVLSVWWNLPTSRYGTRTDDRGEFRIGGLHPEVIPLSSTTDVLAEHQDYIATRIQVPIDPAATEIKDVAIGMRKGVIVAGTAVDEDGRPRRGAQLHLYEYAASPGPIGWALEQYVTTRSAPDGSFRFPPVVAAAEMELMGQHSDAVVTLQSALDVRQSVDDVRLELPSGVLFEVQATFAGAAGPLSADRCHAVLTEGGVPARALHSAHDGRPTLEVRVMPGSPRLLEVGAWWDDGEHGLNLYGTTTVYVDGSPDDPAAVEIEVPLGEPRETPTTSLRYLNATSYFGSDIDFWFWGITPNSTSLGPFTISLASPPLRLEATAHGATGPLRVRIGGGRHFLELRSPGFQSHHFELDVGARGQFQAELSLRTETD